MGRIQMSLEPIDWDKFVAELDGKPLEIDSDKLKINVDYFDLDENGIIMPDPKTVLYSSAPICDTDYFDLLRWSDER